MKNILLAKSNLRKNKGLSICIAILILIAAMFICVSGLLLFDYNKNSYKVAEELNTSDISLYSLPYNTGNTNTVTEKYIDSVISSNVTDYELRRILVTQIPIEFNNGEVTPIVNLITKDELNRHLSKIEIIEEDTNITDNYIYLPYHIHTGGGINIGDTYKIKLPSKTYKFKVKGFINSIYAGSYNSNRYEMMISDEMYKTISKDNPNMEGFDLYINYKDGVNITKETNKLANKIYLDKGVETTSIPLDLTLSSRTFISMIFFVSFLMTAVIIIGIVMLMISNNISNYIKENIKSLGVLKAMGYTTNDIKKSLLIQFSILTVLGLIVGTIAGYIFMPSIAKMLIAQSGIPYTLSFNLIATLITVISIPLFVVIIVLISVKRIKKVEPIEALRDGIESHNFKKNHIPLDKSVLSLNTSLSMKNMFKNLKQNIISFITILFLCFLMVVSMAMYQNFSREPNLSLLTFEIVDGVLASDKNIESKLEYDLKHDKDITKVEYVSNYEIQDKDYTKIQTYIMKDPTLLNNKDNCYEGKYPKYDNEIAVSGKYAKDNKYKIGDEVELHVGDKKRNYLITGFLQSTNNDGREALLTYDGAAKIIEEENLYSTFYFDSKVKASKVIKKYQDKYGESITATMDFEELIKSQMSTFINVANLMVIVMSIISACIIFLVLYLLMKTLIYTRRYEYGILKAIGYKSSDLIKQNVLSFMPTIIIGTIIGTIISYYLTNPYIGLNMRSFGIMKCTMKIPLDLLLISSLFIIGISFISAILMSLKIRKVEPCDLLKGE